MVVKEFLEDLPEYDREGALKAWKWIKRGVLGVMAVIGLAGSFYKVPLDSVGVVRRFGEYVRQEEYGLHLKFPYGIEKVDKVPVKRVQKEELGFRTIESGIDSRYLGVEEISGGKVTTGEIDNLIRESGERPTDKPKADFAQEILKREYLMLTGDLNMADIEWIVQYKIKDPVAYLFNIREPKWTIRDCSQAVVRQLIGNGSVDEAITIGREEYEATAKEMTQKMLDDYNTGIDIVTIKLQSCNPPRNVRNAFNDVNTALQDKETKINMAMRSYNEEIPKAQGEALAVIQRAEGYALERVNKAKGDAEKFNRVYEEYNKAREITRQRLYLEAMTKVLPGIEEKWLIEQEDTGLIKLLRLNEPKSGEGK